MNWRKISLIALVLIIFLVVVMVVVYFLIVPPTVKIEKTTNISPDSSIEFLFNKPFGSKTEKTFRITNQTINVSVTGKFEKSLKSLTFVPDKNTLFPSSEYVIKITPYSILNIKGKEAEFNISTQNIDFNSLSKEQQEIIIKNQDRPEEGTIKGFEITKYLPYDNEYFYMNWKGTNDNIQLYVLLKGDQILAKQKAEEWIKSVGFDPTKMTISYEKF